jgi:aminopeptidase N
MIQKPVCPKINLRSSILALVLMGFLWGLEGCKSSATVAAIAVGEVDTLAVEEDFWGMENELPYQAAATRSMDLLHMDLDLSFDWKSQQVTGMAQLLLTPYFHPQKTVVLDAQDFELEWVGISTENHILELLSYNYDGQELEVYLPKELAPGDTVELVMSYVAFPEKNSGEGSAAITDTKGLYFIDPMDTIPGKPTMLWTQGETQHSSKWFPTIDRPNERLTHDIWLTVPDSLVSISNGRLIKQESLGNGLRKDHWKMDLPHAPYLVAIAVGDFAKVTASHGDLHLGY